jgi:hypothetical protein
MEEQLHKSARTEDHGRSANLTPRLRCSYGETAWALQTGWPDASWAGYTDRLADLLPLGLTMLTLTMDREALIADADYNAQFSALFASASRQPPSLKVIDVRYAHFLPDAAFPLDFPKLRSECWEVGINFTYRIHYAVKTEGLCMFT